MYKYHPKDITFPLNYSMTNPVRMKHLHRAVYEVKDIEGDLVEIGVCRGGSSMCMALSSLRNSSNLRDIRLLDTYAGMTIPCDLDYKPNRKGPLSVLLKWRENQTESHNNWCYGSLDEVKINMARTKYPEQYIHYYKSDITKYEGFIPEKIALLRIDVDFYHATLAALQKFYPRLQTGGILIMDDYNAWNGAKKAWVDFCTESGTDWKVEIIDKSAVFKIKGE